MSLTFISEYNQTYQTYCIVILCLHLTLCYNSVAEFFMISAFISASWASKDLKVDPFVCFSMAQISFSRFSRTCKESSLFGARGLTSFGLWSWFPVSLSSWADLIFSSFLTEARVVQLVFSWWFNSLIWSSFSLNEAWT